MASRELDLGSPTTNHHCSSFFVGYLHDVHCESSRGGTHLTWNPQREECLEAMPDLEAFRSDKTCLFKEH